MRCSCGNSCSFCRNTTVPGSVLAGDRLSFTYAGPPVFGADGSAPTFEAHLDTLKITGHLIEEEGVYLARGKTIEELQADRNLGLHLAVALGIDTSALSVEDAIAAGFAQMPASFEGWAFEFSSAETSLLTTGEKRLVLTHTSCGNRTTVGQCMIDVQPDPLKEGCGSFNERMVKLLREAIEGRMPNQLEGHTINGESISLMTANDLQRLLEKYERRIRIDQDNARVRAGKPSRRTTYTL